MYYYKDKDTIKVEKVKEGEFKYRHRLTKMVSMNPSDISAIPTDQYRTFLDDRIENPDKELPDVLPDKTLVEVGDLCRIAGSMVFKLEKVINNDNLAINILSVQGKSFDKDKKELSEYDCEHLGIKYKKGLYSFNQGTKLKKYDPLEKEWNPNDLSTYPLVGNNTQIKYILLQLGGFKATGDKSVLITPQGQVIDIELFLVSLKVRIKNRIEPLSSSSSWYAGEEVSWSVIYESFNGSEKSSEEEEICDIQGNIYLILRLTKDKQGINPYSVKDKSAGDLFDVSFDLSYSLGRREKEIPEIINISDKLPRYDFNIFKKEGNYHWRSVKVSGTKQIYLPLTQSR